MRHLCRSPDVPKEAAASTQLAAVVRHYKVALTEVSKQLFSGSDKGIEVLHKVIGDGKLLQLKPTGMLDLEQKSKLAPSSRRAAADPGVMQYRSSFTPCSSRPSGG